MLALVDVDATKMSQYLGITEKNQQKMATELILSQENGRALIRSQHFLPYIHVQIKSFEDRKKYPISAILQPSVTTFRAAPQSWHRRKLR